MTAEPMLSLLRPRIEQLVHDRVELELTRAMPLLAEELFDDIWKEKLNKDVQGFVCRTLDQYLDLLRKVDRLLEHFGIDPEPEAVGNEEDPADWWRGEAKDDDWWRGGDDDDGPVEFGTYRPD